MIGMRKVYKNLVSTDLFVAHWRFIWHQGVLLLFFVEAAATIWGSWSPRVLKVIPPQINIEHLPERQYPKQP